MLHHLHIDPKLIHYNEEDETFYWSRFKLLTMCITIWSVDSVMSHWRTFSSLLGSWSSLSCDSSSEVGIKCPLLASSRDAITSVGPCKKTSLQYCFKLLPIPDCSPVRRTSLYDFFKAEQASIPSWLISCHLKFLNHWVTECTSLCDQLKQPVVSLVCLHVCLWCNHYLLIVGTESKSRGKKECLMPSLT